MAWFYINISVSAIPQPKPNPTPTTNTITEFYSVNFISILQFHAGNFTSGDGVVNNCNLITQ